MCNKALSVAVICGLLLSLTACGGQSTQSTTGNTETTTQSTTVTLERYDYVADVNGNSADFTIAQNMKSVKCELKSMGLEVMAFCTIEDNILTFTELADGNEQVYSGLSATTYTLNADGTATPNN